MSAENGYIESQYYLAKYYKHDKNIQYEQDVQKWHNYIKKMVKLVMINQTLLLRT
jgi:hypothetical protein